MIGCFLAGCSDRRTNSNAGLSIPDGDRLAHPLPIQELTAPGAAFATSRDDDWFEDVTNRSGVVWTYRNGREAGRFFMIESFGGGAAVIDFDLDGDCDLWITGGGTISRDRVAAIGGLPSSLFRNQGEWKFENATDAAGFSAPAGYSQGCAVSDFDADGFPDLFVCGYEGSRLYHNRGDGTYLEIDSWESSSRGIAARNNWTTAAVFADFDHDGLADLVIARYARWGPETDVECTKNGVRDLCGPTSYDGTTCLAYRNSGDGLFEDWSDRVGLKGSVHGLAVVAADLNLDGWVDFYIASDVTPNQLYLGGPSLPLVEQARWPGSRSTNGDRQREAWVSTLPISMATVGLTFG